MSTYAIGLSTDMAIMSFLALAAYLLLLVGRVSFGLQAFFGFGAYAAGIGSAMLNWPLPVAVAFAVGLGALVSAAVAWPTMGLSGLRYAIASLAFAEMARIALSQWVWQVNLGDRLVGPNGVEGFRDIRWVLTNDITDAQYLFICLTALAVCVAAIWYLERRRIGVVMRAMGFDETLAQHMGLNTHHIRVMTAATAGAIAALGGALYAHRTTYIEPAVFEPMLGVHSVGYALIGGLGAPFAPLLGVILDLGLLNAFHDLAQWRMVIFGGLVAIFLRLKPRGLVDETLLAAMRNRGAQR